MTMHFPVRTNRKRQRGAALIVGLIMLLLLTLIGVAGLRDTLLQEKMAGNMRDREMALQAAEAALRAGELELQQLNPGFPNNSGRYDLATAAGKATMAREDASNNPISEVKFWADWDWSEEAVQYTKSLEGVSQEPAYVIERLDPALSQRNEYDNVANPNLVVAVDLTPGQFSAETVKPDYRITARGTGTTTDASVIVQSTYRRE